MQVVGSCQRLNFIFMISLTLICGTCFHATCCTNNDPLRISRGKIVWNNEMFTIRVISTQEKNALWEVRRNGNLDLPVIETFSYDKSYRVLNIFDTQSVDKRRDGIFVYSKSYAIPDTPEELQYMTPYLLELYHNEEWRKSESKLIKELQILCKKRKIPLSVNLSANLQGEWKKIAP